MLSLLCLFCVVVACVQSSEELDTDTEFEPVEDMTIETRSRCKLSACFFCVFLNVFLCAIC